jgi:hypothetical protein
MGEAARNQGIEQFTEIRLAALETNGRISFFAEDARSGAAKSPPAGPTVCAGFMGNVRAFVTRSNVAVASIRLPRLVDCLRPLMLGAPVTTNLAITFACWLSYLVARRAAMRSSQRPMTRRPLVVLAGGRRLVCVGVGSVGGLFAPAPGSSVGAGGHRNRPASTFRRPTSPEK